MPMLFWASLAPWEKARNADVTHWERRNHLLMLGLARAKRRIMNFWSSHPTPKPTRGEMTRPMRILATPSILPCAISAKPHLTYPEPAASSVAPTRPPTSACEDEDGMPNHQVPRFHTMAPMIPQRTMIMAVFCGRVPTSMNLPMVLATAVPPNNGPRNSNVATTMTACTGVSAREAIVVAMMFDASWKPLV